MKTFWCVVFVIAGVVGASCWAGQGGPDAFGYTWRDSDASQGPVYEWIDIRETGTPVPGLEFHNYLGPFEIGFPFAFYGKVYHRLYIPSDGAVSFDPQEISCETGPIPQRDGTENVLAWMWSGLHPQAPSQIYIQNFAERMVIQFVDYGHEDGAARAVQAQVMLYRSGKIRYQYHSFTGGMPTDRCVVGMENSDGSDGLQVVRNQSYLKPGLAIEFEPPRPTAVPESPLSGPAYPVAHAGMNRLASVTDLIVLDGRDSHNPYPESDLTYAWSQLDGPEVELRDSDRAQATCRCAEAGIYRFALVVSDGRQFSEPDVVEVYVTEFSTDIQPLRIGYNGNHYFHNPDVYGTTAVYTAGRACDYTCTLTTQDLVSGVRQTYAHPGAENQPKIDGARVVWFAAGNNYNSPWAHEPSNARIFALDLNSGKSRMLRDWTWSDSYSHPAISGTHVVWLEHHDLDPRPRGNLGQRWYDTPYSICGADIADLDHPRYFTIATEVGRRDPYPCHGFHSDFDDVIDISGHWVVWEAGGDIFGADISDLSAIEVFTICDHPARQYDPAVCGDFVVWTDERHDGGDIYGMNISEIGTVYPCAVVRAPGSQQQPALDRCVLAYVDGGVTGSIKACAFNKNLALKPLLLPEVRGMAPAVQGDTLVWQDAVWGKVHGWSLGLILHHPLGPVENTVTGQRYDFVQHAFAAAREGDVLSLQAGIYPEVIDFPAQAVAVIGEAGVQTTRIQGARFPAGASSAYVLEGVSINGPQAGVYCGANSQPTIRRCMIAENQGAGLALDGGSSPLIDNCLISANHLSGISMTTTTGRRGGVFCQPLIRNCTIVQNRGPGISGGQPTLTHCILYYNGVASDSPQLENTQATVTFSCLPDPVTGLGNIHKAPGFRSLGFMVEEGPWLAGDYHLAPDSPCIDIGDPLMTLDPHVTDLDGYPRAVGSALDLGAYEHQE